MSPSRVAFGSLDGWFPRYFSVKSSQARPMTCTGTLPIAADNVIVVLVLNPFGIAHAPIGLKVSGPVLDASLRCATTEEVQAKRRIPALTSSPSRRFAHAFFMTVGVGSRSDLSMPHGLRIF